ncbi:MAG: hypothetical protein HOW71_09295 [Nonomuraea sp.]|nr:hypothetical protein [Nonomuraea sp.]
MPQRAPAAVPVSARVAAWPARRNDLAPRFAWTFAVAFLCLVLPARSAVAVYGAGPLGVGVAAALFVLPLLYAVPRGRAVWARHRNGLLIAQTVLTFLPFVVFGQGWTVGLSGLLGGLLLLTVRAPASWILFTAVLVAEGVLRVGVLPLPRDSWSLTVWAFSSPLNMALASFGLVRMADLVTDLHATRTELAALAVARQRLRSASRLREAISDRLETVTAHATAASALLARGPGQARARLTEAAGVARQALDQVRVVIARDDREPDPPVTGPAGETVAPRVARLVLVVVLCTFATQVLVNVVESATAAAAKAGAAAVIVAVVALQLRHTPARREGVRPRVYAWTLTVQILLSVVPVLVYDEVNLLGMAGFSAGSALLLLPGRWAWAAFAAVAAGVGTLMATYSAYGVYDVVYAATGTAAYGLVVYGLSRLTDLAHRVEAARRDLARLAAVQERMRVARDAHDLLGLGLSVVALKCDLVVQLIGRDDAKARDELRQLLEVAAQARDDVLSVTDEERQRPSLRKELASARDTLAAAGVEVRADLSAVPVPPEVEAVLATVLRESVTNILRHAAAGHCAIVLSATGAAVRLQVTNDGAHSPEPAGGGTGIANLRVRVQALGGHLTTAHDGEGGFELAVEIPVAR